MTTPGDDHVTQGEIVRQLRSVVSRLEDLVHHVDSTYVRKDVYDAHRASLLRDLEDVRMDLSAIQERQRWNWRLIAGMAVSVGGTVLATLLIVKFGIQQ